MSLLVQVKQLNKKMTLVLNLSFLQYLVEVHQYQNLEALLYSVGEIYLYTACLEDILVGPGGWLQTQQLVEDSNYKSLKENKIEHNIHNLAGLWTKLKKILHSYNWYNS